MPNDTNIVKINAAFATDIGLKRKLNEDSGLASFPIFAVSDGMGGHDSGEVASAIVIEELRKLTDPDNPRPTKTKAVIEALKKAHARVQELSASRPHGAGATVCGIALVMRKRVPHWLVFNVGDSRVYRSLNDSLAQWTRDHSVIQLWVEQGIITPAEALNSTRSHEITKAVGAPDSKPDFFFAPVVNTERLLICSDGLYTMVSSEALRASLVMSGTPKTTAESLVERALNAGGHDNITAIVVDVVSGGIPPESDTDSSIVDQSLGAVVNSHHTVEETTIHIPRTNAVPDFDIIGLEDDDDALLAGTGVPSAQSPDADDDIEDTDPGLTPRVATTTSSTSMSYSAMDDSEDLGVSPATQSQVSVSRDADDEDDTVLASDIEDSTVVVSDGDEETVVVVDDDANGDTVIVSDEGDTVIVDADGDTVVVDADGDTVVVNADDDTVLVTGDDNDETIVVDETYDADTVVARPRTSFSSIEADEDEPNDDDNEPIDFIDPVNLNPAPNAPRDFIYNIDDADTNTGF